MSTTKNKLATLNIQLDRDLYMELKDFAHEKKVSLAELFRSFSRQIISTNKSTSQTQEIIEVESNLPITIIPNLSKNDYSTLQAPEDDAASTFRLPSSVRFKK